jgi:two-component system, OmpR family, response regulator RegX3
VSAGPTKVLLVEDELALVDSISYHLLREGFAVCTATDGVMAMERFRTEQPAMVVLDLMLPRMSGLDVCRSIRGESEVPILILTALDSEADKVTSLELGADDYVTKPFSMRELVSRIRAHLRRACIAPTPVPDAHIEGGPVKVDPYRHEAWVRGEHIQLTPKEFDLLLALLKRKGRMLARRFLIDEVWGPGYFGDTKTLDVHVKRLRKKIESEPHLPRHIVTVRGLGYKFVD